MKSQIATFVGLQKCHKSWGGAGTSKRSELVSIGKALGETDVMCTGLPFPSVKDTSPILMVRVGSHAIMGLRQNTDDTFRVNVKRITAAAATNLPIIIGCSSDPHL
jgi:hypothetical protein